MKSLEEFEGVVKGTVVTRKKLQNKVTLVRVKNYKENLEKEFKIREKHIIKAGENIKLTYKTDDAQVNWVSKYSLLDPSGKPTYTDYCCD